MGMKKNKYVIRFHHTYVSRDTALAQFNDNKYGDFWEPLNNYWTI